MSNRNDEIRSILSDIESIDSIRDRCESAANEARSMADDASDEANEAYSKIENAACSASEARDEAERASNYCDDIGMALSELHERVSELSQDDDDDNDDKATIELLTKELEHERAKFARIIQFVQAIADESITLDDNDDDNDDNDDNSES